jgi:hypothetical protein
MAVPMSMPVTVVVTAMKMSCHPMMRCGGTMIADVCGDIRVRDLRADIHLA